MKKQKVIIIGSGIGGLCCGMYLLAAGFEVDIYEQATQPGGVVQAMTLPQTNMPFDPFASIGVHPQRYEEIFRQVGLDPQQYIQCQQLTCLYRLFYSDGSYIDLQQLNQQNPCQFERYFDMPWKAYEQVIQQLYQKYSGAQDGFLNKSFVHWTDMWHPDNWIQALRLRPFSSAQHWIERHVPSKKIQQMLLFQSFYVGLTPSKLSNLYATVPAVTQTQGLAYITGGMAAFAQGLCRAFLDLGGRIYCQQPVQQIGIQDHKACGVVLDNGEQVYSDWVISNVDYVHTMQQLVSGRKEKQSLTMSCSVFMLYVVLSCPPSTLKVHNIWLEPNISQELDGMDQGKLPQQPPIYLYYPGEVDAHFRQTGKYGVSMMVRVPNLVTATWQWDQKTVAYFRKLCLQTLANILNIADIQPFILEEQYQTPHHLQQHFACQHGAAFGLAPTYGQSVMFRPQGPVAGVERLYTVGASNHPGSGISLVSMGAQLVAQQIIAHNARQ